MGYIEKNNIRHDLNNHICSDAVIFSRLLDMNNNGVSYNETVKKIKKDYLKAINDILDEQQVVDIKPVIHAEWKFEGYEIIEYDNGSEEYRPKGFHCTNCKAHIFDGRFKTKYCPCCGAMMHNERTK